MLFHQFFGRVRDCNDYWTTAEGTRYGGFTDRYGTWMALPLDQVSIWQ